MIVQLRKSKKLEKSLKEKIVKEKQRYSNLLQKYKELQPVDHPPELSLDTSQQEEDDKQEELQSSQLQILDEETETQTELTKLQLTMENVNISLEKVEVIMKYWSEKVILLYICTYLSNHGSMNYKSTDHVTYTFNCS